MSSDAEQCLGPHLPELHVEASALAEAQESLISALLMLRGPQRLGSSSVAGCA